MLFIYFVPGFCGVGLFTVLTKEPACGVFRFEVTNVLGRAVDRICFWWDSSPPLPSLPFITGLQGYNPRKKI
jgi:hypothetical protein